VTYNFQSLKLGIKYEMRSQQFSFALFATLSSKFVSMQRPKPKWSQDDVLRSQQPNPRNMEFSNSRSCAQYHFYTLIYPL